VCRKDAFHDEIDDTAVRRRPQRTPFRPTPARCDRRAVHRSAALQQCRHRGAARVGSDGGGWHKAGKTLASVTLPPGRPLTSGISAIHVFALAASNTSLVISLRAHANGDIVTADNAGASPLIANRTAIGQWEEFDLIYD
jgi:hypothetical protein